MASAMIGARDGSAFGYRRGIRSICIGIASREDGSPFAMFIWILGRFGDGVGISLF